MPKCFCGSEAKYVGFTEAEGCTNPKCKWHGAEPKTSDAIVLNESGSATLQPLSQAIAQKTEQWAHLRVLRQETGCEPRTHCMPDRLDGGMDGDRRRVVRQMLTDMLYGYLGTRNADETIARITCDVERFFAQCADTGMIPHWIPADVKVVVNDDVVGVKLSPDMEAYLHMPDRTPGYQATYRPCVVVSSLRYGPILVNSIEHMMALRVITNPEYDPGVGQAKRLFEDGMGMHGIWLVSHPDMREW